MTRPWTKDEEAQLVKMWADDRSRTEMTESLGRSSHGIHCRLALLGCSRVVKVQTWVNNLTPTDRGYVAGIIDGEGTISFRVREDGGWDLAISVGNTCIELIDWLNCKLPGGRSIRKPGGSHWAEHHKPLHLWFWGGRRKVVILLRAICPDLIVKRAVAERILAECDEGRWARKRFDEMLKPALAVDLTRLAHTE